MKRSLFWTLIFRLEKVYRSNVSNKDHEYKRVVFYTLKELGGIYIKFLQVLCVTQNFMDGWGSPKEFDVFNRVETEHINVRNYIKDIDKFESFEKEPFACGSFGQLYKGKLKSGKIVAIKILRPSIEKSLKDDFKKLRKFVKLASLLLSNSLLDYKAAFDKFSQTCSQETDYEREVANMEYFRKLYKGHSYVVIPDVYKEMCAKNVIIQEFIEGPTLSDVIHEVSGDKTLESVAYELTGSNVWTQITIVGGETLRTALVADFIFGDPHPGNIILLKDNKIAFVDFGIVSNKPTSQEAFYLWTKAYYDIMDGRPDYGRLIQTTCMCFCPDYVNALNRCVADKDFISHMADAINAKADTLRGNNEAAKSMEENGHLFRLFTKFIDSNNSLNLKIDMNNFQLLKAMQCFLSAVTIIDNEYGNNNFPEVMKNAMKYALEYCEAKGIPSDLPVNTKYSVNESYELLLDTLSSLATGDEFLFQNISERMF